MARTDRVLVDTNVLLDLVTDDPAWADWSVRQLDAAALRHRLVIDDVIYAELSVGYARIEELDAMLRGTDIDVAPLPRAALFLAGKVFRSYRANCDKIGRGLKTGVLPDFFIGAHAAVDGCPLITRDRRRYRRYFPSVELIAPDA